MTAGESVTVSVAAAFTDPDGDALTYAAISSDAGVASAALSGTSLTVTAVSAGTATVTVTARDPAGLSAAASANVTVMEPNRAPVAAVAVAPPQDRLGGRHHKAGRIAVLHRPGRGRADVLGRQLEHVGGHGLGGGERGVRRGGGRRLDHCSR